MLLQIDVHVQNLNNFSYATNTTMAGFSRPSRSTETQTFSQQWRAGGGRSLLDRSRLPAAVSSTLFLLCKWQRLKNTTKKTEFHPCQLLARPAHGPATLIRTFFACISTNSASEISELVADVRCRTDSRSSPEPGWRRAALSSSRRSISSSTIAADRAASAAHAARAPRRSGAHWPSTMSANPAFTSSQLTSRSVPGKMSSTFWIELVYDCTLS